MLKIIARHSIQSPRLASHISTSRLSLLKPPNLRVSITHTSKRPHVPFKYQYSASNSQPLPENPFENASDNPVGPEDISPEMWLSVLEKTSSAPWLGVIPSDPEDRLRRSFTLLLQILLYLRGRPQNLDAANQFLLAFESTPVSLTSEIGRARRSTAIILRTVVRDILSIPVNSPLREKHPDLFGTYGALVPLSDIYLGEANGEVEEWREFWPRAQPIVLELVELLTSAGYGLDLEQLADQQDAQKSQES